MNSVGILYIECPEQEKQDAFSVKEEISQDEYVRMLREYSSTIGMKSNSNNTMSRYGIYDIPQEHYEEKEEYTKCSAKIYDISGKLCDINEIYKIQKNGMGVIIFELTDQEVSESFESEFRIWQKESLKINNDESIDKNSKLQFLPTKDLRFEIDYHLFELSGCKLYLDYGNNRFAIIIQKIKEV